MKTAFVYNNSSDSNSIEFRSSQIELAVNVGLHYYFKKWTLGARLTNDLTPFYTSRQLEPNGCGSILM